MKKRTFMSESQLNEYVDTTSKAIVLLVDDNSMNLMILEKMFEMMP